MSRKQQGRKRAAKHTEVIVDTLPKCDFCDNQANYDGRTKMGPWANMCEVDFKTYGVGLGPAKGQRLILRTENEDKEEIAAASETDHLKRRLLNDTFRQSLGRLGGGQVVMTRGVDALPEDTKVKIFFAVRDFKDFDDGNDPYGEHDFGSLEIDGQKLFWKIDYYDADYQRHGDANRVLTIMLAEEY